MTTLTGFTHHWLLHAENSLALTVTLFAALLALVSSMVWLSYRKHQYLLWLSAALLLAAGGYIVQEVHEGNLQAAHAGRTMEQAIAEIVQVTSLISDISLASGEQSNGVSQVAEAVAHMDQTTQKNAASIEEMAGAAESLRQQADELVRAVAAFRLQGGATAVQHAAPAGLPAAPSVAAAPPAPPSARAEAPKLAPFKAQTATPPKPPKPALAAAQPRPSAAKTPVAAGAEDDWETF